MRPNLGLLVATCAATAALACSSPTGIIVEVTWDPARVPASADQLHIYVGTANAVRDAVAPWLVNDGGTVVPLAGLTPPYRYLLSPSGSLDAIGALRVGAAITQPAGPTVRDVAIGVGDGGVVRFAAEEVRVVPVDIVFGGGSVSGVDGQCVQFGPGDVIGAPGDADCDGVLDADDCGELDPRDTAQRSDPDGDGAACGDCLEGTDLVNIGGRLIAPASVNPSQDEQRFRQQNQIPPTVTCLHIDFNCSGTCDGGGDLDGSASNACGQTAPTDHGVGCEAAPSDCDEADPGDTLVPGDPERCDGQDSTCDGRPSPNLPCDASDGSPNPCLVGVTMCDDRLGSFGACTAIGGRLLLGSEACQALRSVDQCAFDDDPLACSGAPIHQCEVAVPGASPCVIDEQLDLPGLPIPDPGDSCEWRVVGGVLQADWDVGFAAGGMGGPLADQTTTCAPRLTVRPAHAEPVQRTVMVMGFFRISPTVPIVRFLKLKAREDAAGCDGVITCEPNVIAP
ncbi:MAG: hypothetical protein R3B06_03105 [Kofleriaceae bacterium]